MLYSQFVILLIRHLDINECSTAYTCDSNADCVNTVGSYTCHCRNGFTGNGQSCTGNFMILMTSKPVQKVLRWK